MRRPILDAFELDAYQLAYAPLTQLLRGRDRELVQRALQQRTPSLLVARARNQANPDGHVGERGPPAGRAAHREACSRVLQLCNRLISDLNHLIARARCAVRGRRCPAQ